MTKKIIKRCLPILSILVFFATSTIAQTLFNSGKYEEALQTLEQSGLKTSADFFNAGLCHFKLNHLGQALAYFEKAHSLDKKNDDILFNRDLTKNTMKRVGTLPKDQSFWFGSFVPLAQNFPTWIIWLFFAISAITLAQTISNKTKKTPNSVKNLWRNPPVITLGITMILLLFGGLSFEIAQKEERSIVRAEHTTARSGPGIQFTELFQLQAGSVVRTDEKRDGWLKISFSLGNVGWVMEKDLLTL